MTDIRKSRASYNGAVTKAMAQTDSMPHSCVEEVADVKLKEVDKLLKSLLRTENNFTATLDEAQEFSPEGEADDAFQEEEESVFATFEQNVATVRDKLETIRDLKNIQEGLADLTHEMSTLQNTLTGLPDGNHVLQFSSINDAFAALKLDYRKAALPREHPLKGELDACSKDIQALSSHTARAVTGPSPVTASSSHSTSSTPPAPVKSTFKVDPVSVPTFSGRTEDWLPFWRVFKKAIHDKVDLDDDIRLTYLIRAMKDPIMRDSYSQRMDDHAAYKTIIGELHEEFDKPRWMHRRYWYQLKTLETIPHTREAMKGLLTKIDTIYKGFRRLKKSDVQFILTSAIEEVISTELRTLWNQRTDSVKEVPPIEELITFIKLQADQMDQLYKPEPLKIPRPPGKVQHPSPSRYKQRGTANVITSNSASDDHHSEPFQPPQSPRAAPKYSCPLCPEHHYPYHCSHFNEFSLTERKQHVQDNVLCTMCLKPHHTAANCTSTYKCRFCRGNHHSLLHSTATPNISNSATISSPTKGYLTMTSQVILTGPTGVSTKVRALLDSGSTISILSSKVMRTLSLQHTRERTLIKGVGDNSLVQAMMTKVQLSSSNKEFGMNISVAVIKKVSSDMPLQIALSTNKLPHIKNLQLADNKYHCPGPIDIILGCDVFGEAVLGRRIKGPPNTPTAHLTVFGWGLTGPYIPDKITAPQYQMTATATDYINEETANLPAEEILARLLVMEEPEEKERIFTQEEKMVEDHFDKTYSYDKTQRRYTVRLPMKGSTQQLGDSRSQAIHRAKANDKSLKRKGYHNKYQEVMQKYVDEKHAILLTPEEVKNSTTAYYMPVHAVFKESSSTTKVRAVFDASAETSNHTSLNKLMAAGPTLQPPLDHTLLRFRMYPVALSGDISQMYREVLLHPDDQRFHRFIWKPEEDQPWQDYQMTRVTFGVTASPYLAVKVLLQAAKDFATSSEAKFHLTRSFYVDDFLGGAPTSEEALILYNDLKSVLEKAGFHLKKWRSSSTAVLEEIPKEIQEPLPQQELIDEHGANYPRALGVAWNSREDTMATHVSLPSNYSSSKRGVSSDIARTFDVLGWVSPAILPMKLLYRALWLNKASWDAELPEKEKRQHDQWRQQLQDLTSIKLPRHYFDSQIPTTIELHGFCDASEFAYAACIYVRATYSSRSPTSLLVNAKTKVAPIKNRSIPQLELCGAYLLARLMAAVRQALDIEKSHCYAYCDNTTTLAWLTASPHRFKVFVANRVVNTTALIPETAWRHVPTLDNPADCATRGLTAKALTTHHLWWGGPPWLLHQPVSVPTQPAEEELEEERHQEAKPEVCHVATCQTELLENRISSYHKLVKVTSYLRRLVNKAQGKPRSINQELSLAEYLGAEGLLYQRSQQRSFSKEIDKLKKPPPKSKKSPPKNSLTPLQPFLDNKGILRVGGRFQRSSLPLNQKNPILLSASDVLTKKLFQWYHLQLGHSGPSSLLNHSANVLYTLGARRLARTVCSQCVVCRKAAVKAGPQIMGQLPPSRLEPNAVFSTTGLDLAGPYMVRTSHTRHPVFEKGYMIVFVCFCTKAVHLELVMNQSTEQFIAALERFISRRGLPCHIHSDNGKNFTGAKNELQEFYNKLQSRETQNHVQTYLLTHKIQWHNSPERAPHFGGLWEAAVRSAKFHLKRVIGPQKFTYNELTTIFCKVESYLNSRPLGAITSHPTDGVTPLTPGHFLIGRALRSYPQPKVDFNPTGLQRWVLCQKTTEQFWKRWSAEYLQQLQRSVKWHQKSRNFAIGDMVMMTDGSVYCAQWSMAKVVAVYPGSDGVVRAVDVQMEHVVEPTRYNSRKQYLEGLKTKTAIYRRPTTKLALLLGADELPEKAADNQDPDHQPSD